MTTQTASNLTVKPASEFTFDDINERGECFLARMTIKMVQIANGVKPQDDLYTECLECSILPGMADIYGPATANDLTASFYTIAGHKLAKK